MDVILGALGGLLGGLWCLLEGFWAVFGAMLRPCWRPWGRFWGLWELLGPILEALAGVSEAPEGILRHFGRVSEVSEAILQVSRGFHSVFTGLHLCYKFTEVFTVCSPRWRAKRAPLASEDPLGPILAPNWDHLGPKLVQQLQVSSAIPTNFY